MMNTKTERLLRALAFVLRDERPGLIADVHEAINDNGYPYDFREKAFTFRAFTIEGERRSYGNLD